MQLPDVRDNISFFTLEYADKLSDSYVKHTIRFKPKKTIPLKEGKIIFMSRYYTEEYVVYMLKEKRKEFLEKLLSHVKEDRYIFFTKQLKILNGGWVGFLTKTFFPVRDRKITYSLKFKSQPNSTYLFNSIFIIKGKVHINDLLKHVILLHEGPCRKTPKYIQIKNYSRIPKIMNWYKKFHEKKVNCLMMKRDNGIMLDSEKYPSYGDITVTDNEQVRRIWEEQNKRIYYTKDAKILYMPRTGFEYGVLIHNPVIERPWRWFRRGILVIPELDPMWHKLSSYVNEQDAPFFLGAQVTIYTGDCEVVHSSYILTGYTQLYFDDCDVGHHRDDFVLVQGKIHRDELLKFAIRFFDYPNRTNKKYARITIKDSILDSSKHQEIHSIQVSNDERTRKRWERTDKRKYYDIRKIITRQERIDHLYRKHFLLYSFKN